MQLAALENIEKPSASKMSWVQILQLEKGNKVALAVWRIEQGFIWQYKISAVFMKQYRNKDIR